MGPPLPRVSTVLPAFWYSLAGGNWNVVQRDKISGEEESRMQCRGPRWNKTRILLALAAKGTFVQVKCKEKV